MTRAFSFSPLRDSCPRIRVHRFTVLSQLSQAVKKPRKTSGTKVATDLPSFPRSPKSLFSKQLPTSLSLNSILQLNIILSKRSTVVNRSNRLFDRKPLLHYLTITLQLPHNYPDWLLDTLPNGTNDIQIFDFFGDEPPLKKSSNLSEWLTICIVQGGSFSFKHYVHCPNYFYGSKSYQSIPI